MININILDITPDQYKKLIIYLLDGCDEISFQFPGIYDNGKPLTEAYWQNYHKSIKNLLNDCYNHGAKKMYSKHYQGMHLGVYGVIIYVKPFASLKQMLLANHLFDWLSENNLPEDVCFYSNKKLRVFTCSHEEEIYLYNETSKDIHFLTDNSFEFHLRKTGDDK